MRAYRDSGLTYGFYASIDPWPHLVGMARYQAPEWRTVRPAKKSTALAKCRTKSVQGGKVVLAQWWNKKSGFDVVWPGFRTDEKMSDYFHRYRRVRGLSAAADRPPRRTRRAGRGRRVPGTAACAT